MEPRPMGRLEYLVGYLCGKALVWLGKRAHRRGDAHELMHCLAALRAGDSDHSSGCVPLEYPELGEALVSTAQAPMGRDGGEIGAPATAGATVGGRA